MDLNPITLFRNNLSGSRTLRILFVTLILSWLILSYAIIFCGVAIATGALLAFFHVFTWYFALATLSGVNRHRDTFQTAGSHRLASIVDYACQGILVFCQILFLLAVFRLLESA